LARRIFNETAPGHPAAKAERRRAESHPKPHQSHPKTREKRRNVMTAKAEHRAGAIRMELRKRIAGQRADIQAVLS
jgi:hypothetical protein